MPTYLRRQIALLRMPIRRKTNTLRTFRSRGTASSRTNSISSAHTAYAVVQLREVNIRLSRALLFPSTTRARFATPILYTFSMSCLNDARNISRSDLRKRIFRPITRK